MAGNPPDPRKAPRWAKVALGLGLVLLAIAGAGGLGLNTVTERYEGSVIRQLLLDPAARRDRPTMAGPLNYLLVGSDQRTGSTNPDQRSDTIIIAHVPAGLNRAYLISLPRDLLVQIPAAPVTSYPGGADKINAAFHHGGGGESGTRLLSVTVSQLTGIRFDGAALIDFSGFLRVIDLLGGVRMCVDTPVTSFHTGTFFEPGCHEMDGARALDYARQRYDLPAGDYDRQRHQQQLLRAILEKSAAADLARNPVRLDQFIRAVGAALTLDSNGVTLHDLAFALRGVRSDAMLGVQVPSHSELIDEVSYVVLDPTAAGLFESLRGADMDNWAQANPQWVNRL